MTNQQKQTIQQQHADHVLRSVERQRNEALSREAQKDAVIALLQAQSGALMERLREAETKMQELETAGQRKKTKAA